MRSPCAVMRWQQRAGVTHQVAGRDCSLHSWYCSTSWVLILPSWWTSGVHCTVLRARSTICLRSSVDTMSLEAARWLRVAGQDIDSHLQDLQRLLPDPGALQLDVQQRRQFMEQEALLPSSATLADIRAYLAPFPCGSRNRLHGPLRNARRSAGRHFTALSGAGERDVVRLSL